MITEMDTLDKNISSAFEIESIRNFNKEIGNELDSNIKLLNIEIIQLTELLVLNGTLLIEGN